MLQLVDPVVYRNVEVIISNKIGSNQGFPEACDRLRFIIQIENGSDVDLIKHYSLIIDHTNLEHSVVLIPNRINISSISLLDVIHLYVGAFEGLFKHSLKSR